MAAETTKLPVEDDVTVSADKKWPGWPGDNVFRLIVPVLKVGSIIGRKGEVIKKMCEETKARIRVLEGALGTADRIVLVSGKEEPEAPISPAMVGVLKIFKRVVGIETEEPDAVAGIPFCAIRLLVPSSQASHLIGKQGSQIKAIQEGTGASVRVLSGSDEVPFYATSDERIVEIQGDGQKVLKALEAVIERLRKFLVDHSIVALFEKSITQTMQIPLSYAEDIIGIGGTNIGYIRRTSGAVLTVQENRGILDEITIEIKGTSSQVQAVQQLIEEFMAGHKEPVRSSYGNFDTGLSSSYPQFGNSSYPSAQPPLGGYGSSGVGGYSSYRY
ncbi:hypothetical protein GIB67_009847 [Kingdonia uniflora]|uniref:K Homology domain-containing protein n=1 Tax=Kingdonia uniflora TaxID=39325 RepID=A0A7J7LMI1_9MAGN|nr:hypothetical protein GIB67_009847 [Kingdonia uniflora]